MENKNLECCEKCFIELTYKEAMVRNNCKNADCPCHKPMQSSSNPMQTEKKCCEKCDNRTPGYAGIDVGSIDSRHCSNPNCFCHTKKNPEECKHWGTLDKLRCKTCLGRVAREANEDQRKMMGLGNPPETGLDDIEKEYLKGSNTKQYKGKGDTINITSPETGLEWEKEFDERFGKDGPEVNCDSIGRSAGCDDCAESIEIRREHKEFLMKALSQNSQKLREVVEGMKRKHTENHDLKEIKVKKLKADGTLQEEIVTLVSGWENKVEVGGYNQAIEDILKKI